jgi:hypothetical protein
MISRIKQILSILAPTLFLRNTKTVHYAFSFFVLAVLITSIASVIGTEKAAIILETSKTNVATDDVFMVRVYAVATTPVNAISLAIEVPTNMVEVLGIDRGESVITLWTADPRYENGFVYLEGGTYRKGFVGKHLIATINVKAKQSGLANILTNNASLLAGDGRGTEVTTTLDERSESRVKISTAAEITAVDATIVIVSDIDGDGKVTLRDIQSFMTAWFSRSTRYDFNNDGEMSFKDFSILLAKFFSPA